jgi:hypothetical protein
MRSRSPRKSKVASAALWCSPSLNTTTSHYKAFLVSSLAQPLRQPRDIRRDPPRLVANGVAWPREKANLCPLSHPAAKKSDKRGMGDFLASEGVLMSTLSELRAKKSALSSWLSTAKNSDLAAVAIFCAIGLLVMFNVMLRLPDLGAIIAQYNQF